MKGKRVFITGAGAGIGKATAMLALQSGAKTIIIGDINDEKLKTATADLRTTGVEVIGIKIDVSCFDSINKGFQQINEKCDGIDVLVNSAGICAVTPFNKITVDEWEQIIKVNLSGTFMCCQKAIQMMVERKIKGSIINLSSIAGKVGGIFSGAHYAASKAGVNCLTMSAAKFAAPYGIRVNAIAPGPIETEMTRDWDANIKNVLVQSIPLKRFGNADDVAKAIIFLAGSDASYITGEILDVNGGALTD